MSLKTYNLPESSIKKLKLDSIRYRDLTSLGDSSPMWQSRYLRELIEIGHQLLSQCEAKGITPQQYLDRQRQP